MPQQVEANPMQAEAGRPAPVQHSKPAATPVPLSYAEPDPQRRISWLDLAGHAMLGVGLALVLGGFVGKEYSFGADFGDFLRMYYPHMLMSGGFIIGMLISVRMGPFTR